MSRPRAPFRQIDVARAVRGAIKAGLKVTSVEIDAEGKIVVKSGDKPGDALPPGAAPEDFEARVQEVFDRRPARRRI